MVTYGDLVTVRALKKKNHEAATYRQLAPVHVMPYFTTHCRGGKTDKGVNHAVVIVRNKGVITAIGI